MTVRMPFWMAVITAALVLLPIHTLRAQQAASAPPAAAGPPPAAAGPQVPSWFPLPKEHADYVEKILAHWENKSKDVQRYRCRFNRWEYDPNWVGDPKVPKSFAKGLITYAAPDKGKYQVEESMQVVLPLTPGQEPKFTSDPEELNEHWVCDGKSIFEFEGREKQLIQRELPPEMRGKQIVEGPLPFLFGARAEMIKTRYWIRAILPPPMQGAVTLEAEPKTREDAANFKKVRIIISENEDFLPEGLVLFHRNGAYTTFAFEQREKNWVDLAEKLFIFHRQFFEPKTPMGWTKVVERYQEPATIPASAPSPAALQTQRLPTTTPR